MAGGLCGTGAGIAQMSGIFWGCGAGARGGVEIDVLTVNSVSGIGAVIAQSVVDGFARWEWGVWLVRGGSVLVVVVSE